MAMCNCMGPSGMCRCAQLMRDTLALASVQNMPPFLPTIRNMLPKPPRFRKGRDVSARRASKLRKRGEYVYFSGWTNTGKTRYSWGGPIPDTFRLHFPSPPDSGDGKR